MMDREEFIEEIDYQTAREYFNYCPETGVMLWRKSPGGRVAVGREVGPGMNDGYKTVALHGKHYMVHRVIWLLMTGSFPPKQIDHKNQIRADNRWRNLRAVTNQENQCNAKLRDDSTSGITGIGWSKACGKWMARIQFKGKRIGLGFYDDLAVAIAVRKSAEEKYGFHPNHGLNRS